MGKDNKIIRYLNRGRLKNIKNTKIMVGGCFEVIHYGHLQFLKNTKKHADKLIVALEPDEFIKKNKNRVPIHNQVQRAQLLASFDFVDYILLLPLFTSDKDYQKMVTDIRPDMVAVTKGDPQFENKREQIESVGGKIIVASKYFKRYSTKSIINKIR